MKRTFLKFYGFFFLLLISCQKPTLLPQSEPVFSPVFSEGVNYQRQNFMAVTIDTPLAVRRTVSITGNPTPTLYLVYNQLLFATQDGRIYSLSADDFSKKADTKIAKAIGASPTFWQNFFFIPILKGKSGLIRYDFRSGKAVALGSVPLSGSSPVVWQNKVFHATHEGMVLCINSQNNQTLWQSKLNGQIIRSLAFDGERLFALSRNGYLRCFNPQTGAIYWGQNFTEHFYCSPLVTKNRLYIASYEGNVTVLNKTNGALIKHIPLHSPIYTALSATDNLLIVATSDGMLRGFSHGLTQLWQIELDAPAAIPALISNHLITIGTFQKSLYLLERSDGSVAQKITLKGRPLSLPLYFKEHLILAIEYEKLIQLQVEK